MEFKFKVDDIIFYKYLKTLKSNAHVYITIKSIKLKEITLDKIIDKDKDKGIGYETAIRPLNHDYRELFFADVIIELYKKKPELLFYKSFLVLKYRNFPNYYYYELDIKYEYRALRDYPCDPKILEGLVQTTNLTEEEIKEGLVEKKLEKFQTTDLTEEEIKEVEKKTKPKINIYWVRHGFSCANYIKKKNEGSYNPFKLIEHTSVKDPKLHIVGREQAQQLAEEFNKNNIKIDLVCSSQLLRAIETAQTLYNRLDTCSGEIMILPQICETGNTDDNKPYRFINGKKPSGTTQLENLDYKSYYPNYEYFLRNVLVSLKNYLISKKVIQEYNIIIVSHSSFLKSIFNIKLNNCEYILEKNALNNHKEIIELSNEIKSKSWFGNSSFEEAKKLIFEKNKNNYIYIPKKPVKTFTQIEEEGGCEDSDKDFGFKSKTKSKTKTKTKTKSKKSKTKSKTKSKKSKKSKTKKSKTKY